MAIYRFCKFLAFSSFAFANLWGISSFSLTSIVQPSFSYEGHLTDSSGNPLDLSGGSTVYFQVMAGTCVLYQESTSASSTTGDINYTIGSSTNTIANSATLVNVFSDVTSITGNVASSSPGASLLGGACNSAVGPSSARFLRVSVVQSGAVKVTGDVQLSSTPMALSARNVSKDFFNANDFTINNGTFLSLGTLSGSVPGSYGSSVLIPTFSVDAYGRITGITESSLSLAGNSTGTFSGKIVAGAGSSLTAGSITSGSIVTSLITASNITSGTITNSRYSGILSSVTAATFSGAVDFSGATINGLNTSAAGTFSGLIIGGSGSSITSGTFTSGNIINSTITGSNSSAGVSTGGTFNSSVVTSATISGGVHTGGSFTTGTFNSPTVTSATISGGVHTGGLFTTGTFNSSVMNAGSITTATLNAPKINNGTFAGNLDLLSATLVTAGSGCIYSDSTGNLSLAACSGAGGAGTVTQVVAGTGIIANAGGITSIGTISLNTAMTGLTFSGSNTYSGNNSYTGSNTFTTIKANTGTFSGVLSLVSVATFSGGVVDFSGATSVDFTGTPVSILGGSISGGTITTPKINGGTVTSATFISGSYSGGTLSGAKINSSTLNTPVFVGNIDLSSGTLSLPAPSGGGCLAVDATGVFSIAACSGGGGGSGTVLLVTAGTGMISNPGGFSTSGTLSLNTAMTGLTFSGANTYSGINTYSAQQNFDNGLSVGAGSTVSKIVKCNITVALVTTGLVTYTCTGATAASSCSCSFASGNTALRINNTYSGTDLVGLNIQAAPTGSAVTGNCICFN